MLGSKDIFTIFVIEINTNKKISTMTATKTTTGKRANKVLSSQTVSAAFATFKDNEILTEKQVENHLPDYVSGEIIAEIFNCATYDNCTGLIYFDTVPFTVETLAALGNWFNTMGGQFATEVVIEDKINGGKVTINKARLDMLLDKVQEVGTAKIASSEDF